MGPLDWVKGGTAPDYLLPSLLLTSSSKGFQTLFPFRLHPGGSVPEGRVFVGITPDISPGLHHGGRHGIEDPPDLPLRKAAVRDAECAQRRSTPPFL